MDINSKFKPVNTRHGIVKIDCYLWIGLTFKNIFQEISSFTCIVECILLAVWYLIEKSPKY